jgi:hypothetical protein
MSRSLSQKSNFGSFPEHFPSNLAMIRLQIGTLFGTMAKGIGGSEYG